MSILVYQYSVYQYIRISVYQNISISVYQYTTIISIISIGHLGKRGRRILVGPW